MYENEQRVERVILAAVCCGDEDDTRASLRELGALAETAGACVVGTVMQNREYPDPGTYMGSGKIEEIREMVVMLDADGVICDDELSPAQMSNLEEALDCRVADRTLLILDIFAGRAQTSEGKIQVELAQLKYRQAHLVGMRNYLSRLGGGIGTRGPGEKKLEIDRRLIAERIRALGRELKEVRKHREVLRAGRKKGNVRQVAIVGYTNAGKSTLMNALVKRYGNGDKVYTEDKLFATLDTTVRKLRIPYGNLNEQYKCMEILLSDTVGFISDIPHDLINAFRSTLEEAVMADILLNVVDVSSPDHAMHTEVTLKTLAEIGAGAIPVITVMNKCDASGIETGIRPGDDNRIYISAGNGKGIEELAEMLTKSLFRKNTH
jgi:GTP-binding protein HflX